MRHCFRHIYTYIVSHFYAQYLCQNLEFLFVVGLSNSFSNRWKSIFGASEDDVRKLAEINDMPKETEPPQEIKQPAGGLASAADLLKQEEEQFRHWDKSFRSKYSLGPIIDY